MKAFNKKTDHELIHLFTDGNLEALEALVLRHKDKLYTSILFLVKDKYLAEDIFQDVFIRIIDTMRSGRYTEEGKFLPWAMRIAHNLCVDHFRKVKRTPTIKNEEAPKSRSCSRYARTITRRPERSNYSSSLC